MPDEKTIHYIKELLSVKIMLDEITCYVKEKKVKHNPDMLWMACLGIDSELKLHSVDIDRYLMGGGLIIDGYTIEGGE